MSQSAEEQGHEPAPVTPIVPGTVPTATRQDLQLGRRIFHMSTGTTVATLYALFLDHHQVVYILGTFACVLYVFEHARIAYPEIGERMVWVNKFFLRAEERLKEAASGPHAVG